MGQKWIVLGDRTSHGGHVIEASGVSATNGIAIARVGDKVTCPRAGHGTCIIVSGDLTVIIDGQPVARDGDKIECGAVLIANQSMTTSD